MPWGSSEKLRTWDCEVPRGMQKQAPGIRRCCFDGALGTLPHHAEEGVWLRGSPHCSHRRKLGENSPQAQSGPGDAAPRDRREIRLVVSGFAKMWQQDIEIPTVNQKSLDNKQIKHAQGRTFTP